MRPKEDIGETQSQYRGHECGQPRGDADDEKYDERRCEEANPNGAVHNPRLHRSSLDRSYNRPMPRLVVIFIIIEVAFTIFAFVDVILTEEWRVRRGIPKVVWLVIVVLFSPIGGILWFVLGREPVDKVRPAGPPRAPVAPDDDPAFFNSLRRDEERDERIRKLEQQLAELDDDQPKE